MLIKLFTWRGCEAGGQFMTRACKVVKRPRTAKWYCCSSISAGILLCHRDRPPSRPAHKPTHRDQSTEYKFPNLPLNLTSAPALLPHSRPAVGKQSETEQQRRLKSALTFVTQKCNFATLGNLITTQGQRKYFKSINESRS